MAETDTCRIPTSMRQLRVLEALVARPDPTTPSDLARDIGLSKQTVHRLCMGLLAEGFIIRDDAGGRLRPGRRARDLASGLLYSSTTHLARHQILEALAKELGETVNYVVPGDGGMSYHDRVETRWPFRINFPVGTTVPFHCTASGKAYLSTLPRAEQKRLVTVMSLEPLTPNTITSTDDLLADLRKAGRQGYAIDDEEFHEGMVAIAVPVRSQSGKYLASLGVHAPTQRMSRADAEHHVGAVQEAARNLTETMN